MPETARGAASETLAAALRRASGELHSAGIEDAGNDARRLLAWVLGLSGAQLLSRSELTLGPEQSVAFDRCVAKRRGREPVARIIGAREFYGRSFAISPATLDQPRTSAGLTEPVAPTDRPERFVALVVFDNTDGELRPGDIVRAKIYSRRASYAARAWRVLRHWLQTIIW